MRIFTKGEPWLSRRAAVALVGAVALTVIAPTSAYAAETGLVADDQDGYHAVIAATNSRADMLADELDHAKGDLAVIKASDLPEGDATRAALAHEVDEAGRWAQHREEYDLNVFNAKATTDGAKVYRDDLSKVYAKVSLARIAMVDARDAKVLADAKAAFKAKADEANAMLASIKGQTDAGYGSDDLDALRAALADAAKDGKDPKAVDALTAKVAGLTPKVKDGAKAFAEEQARKAAEAAAAAARAQAAAQVAASYGSGSGYARSSSGYARSSGSGYARSSGASGYSVGGGCTSVAQCQGYLDAGGQNTMYAYQSGNGTFYGIHNNRGGSAMLGQHSVTINGQSRSVGEWTPALMRNGKAYAVNTDPNKQYVQTCGPNGQVYYAPIN